MVYCGECGAKLISGNKFCPKCGAKHETGASSKKAGTETRAEETTPAVSAVPAKPTAPAKPNIPAGQKVAGFLIGIFIVFAVIYFVSGPDFFDDFTSDVGHCDTEAGSTTCGFCAATMSCQYCPGASTCSFATPGDTCSKLSCTSGGSSSSSGSGLTIAQQYCNPGYCLSNGHCCPSSSRYYCEGSCYATQNAANSASNGRCNNYTVYC